MKLMFGYLALGLLSTAIFAAKGDVAGLTASLAWLLAWGVVFAWLRSQGKPG